MHPIGSFAQALLDVASKPLQPTLVGSLCFQLRRPARYYHWTIPLDRRRQDEIQLQRQSIRHQSAIVCGAVEIGGFPVPFSPTIPTFWLVGVTTETSSNKSLPPIADGKCEF